MSDFKVIGAGGCGAIFHQAGSSAVVKVSKATNGDETALVNDYHQHNLILATIASQSSISISVPQCHYYISKSQFGEFENQHPGLRSAAEKLPRPPVVPVNCLVTERICPLPEETRLLLIERFCHPHLQERAIADPCNVDCLVRMYLGSVSGKISPVMFSLRNFNLHLNQMLGMNLDVERMAETVARTLAILHWEAKTDARDVEFVLGGSSAKGAMSKTSEETEDMRNTAYTGPVTFLNRSFFHDETELWLLDFNEVCPITFDEAGVLQAVDAFFDNDPYFPRPGHDSRDQNSLWLVFVKIYLESSAAILATHESPVKGLPGVFIDQVERRSEKKIES